jgi:hypothetical protein
MNIVAWIIGFLVSLILSIGLALGYVFITFMNPQGTDLYMQTWRELFAHMFGGTLVEPQQPMLMRPKKRRFRLF